MIVNLRNNILICSLILILQLLIVQNTDGQTYQTNGDAVAFGNMLKMTNSTPLSGAGVWQQSSAWSTTKVDLSQPFDQTFEMFFGCDAGANGGDGITFTFQNQGINALGGGGGFLGLGGITPAVSIEFDTYDASIFGATNEIAADHIAIDVNGDVNNTNQSFIGTNGSTTVQAISAGRDLEDCASMANDYLTVRIVWNPATTTLQLYEDGVLTLTYTNDIVTNVFSGNSSVYWGFTSATGSASNEQWVAPVGSIIPWTCSIATSCCTPFSPVPTDASPVICNTPIVLGLTSAYTSYSWSSGGSASTESITVPGTYIVNVTETQLGVNCPGSATINVSTTGPTADITGDASICNDGVSTTPLSVALTGTAPWSITYAINGIAQPVITGINSSPYVFSGMAPNIYTLVSVSDVSGCNGFVSGSATIGILTGSPVTINNTFVSPGTTVLSAVDDGGTYDWYETATSVTPLLTNSLTFTTPTLTAATTYYVHNSAIVNKSVALLNVAEGNGPAPNDVGTNLPPAVVYLDFTANTNFDLTSITAEVFGTGAGTGNITINITSYVTAPPFAGAETAVATVSNVAIAAGYNMIPVPLTYSCVAGTNYHISYSASGMAQTTIHWQLVAASSFPIVTDSELSIYQYGIPNTRYPGLFDWQITAASPGAGCRSAVVASPFVPPVLGCSIVASAQGGADILLTNSDVTSVTLSGLSSTFDTNVLLPQQYYWSIINPDTLSTISKQADVTIRFAMEGIGADYPEGSYTFYLITKQGACMDTTQVSFNVVRFFIPNLITSNGDNKNDQFEISTISGRFNLEMYNRWGSIIYSEKGYTNAWDVRSISDGIYYYSIQDSFTSTNYKGWVQVLH